MLEDYYITECFMAYQSEAELENLLIEQLKNQGYESANIQNYEELEANFKEQFARFFLQLFHFLQNAAFR